MSYCTIEDIRAEGVSEDQYSDEALEALIKLSCDYIDRVTGQFFEPREQSVSLDGRGGRCLVLPAFLISCEAVYADDILLEPDSYILYNRFFPEDDRPYPKIIRPQRWPKGFMNITVDGTWGYVEADMSTPPMIKRAAMKLAVYNFPALNDAEAQEVRNIRGLLTSETTDGHSYELSDDAVANLSAEAITGDAEIDEILKYYTRSHFRMALA